VTTSQHGGHREEWHLGVEPDDHQEHELIERPSVTARSLSRERLERPLHVITVEHLGWVAIAAYAVLTRLATLGARPLGSIEAAHALYELDLANTGIRTASAFHPACAGWIHMLTAAIFTLGGVHDFTARIVFAVSGLAMITMAFALRNYLGRAGGLALGALLALSPSVTAFSRASATATPAGAMTLVTIAAFLALKSRPVAGRAAALGLFAGLLMSADPGGPITVAIFVAALLPIGLWELVTRKNVGLAIRIWLHRFSSRLVLVIVVAVVVWMLSQMMIPGGLQGATIARSVISFGALGMPAFAAGVIAGLHFYLPMLALYDFVLVIAAIFGALVILTLNVRTRFAVWALMWATLSVAFFLWSPQRSAESIVAMLTPAALIGAIGIDWLHHRGVWLMARLPLALIVVLSLYIGAVANFVCDTPDASEPPWARHANLFWGAAATSEQTRLYCREAAAELTAASATVFFDDEISAPLRWYLRDLRPIATADAATVVVTNKPNPAMRAAPAAAIYHFDYDQGWLPSFRGARTGEIVRFMLSGRTWGPVTGDDVTILVRKLPSSASTVILAPNE
jgi:uncharacterized protein (TIGR03663 family)